MAKLPFVALAGSVIDEAKKVIWPARQTVVRHTVMVVVSVAIGTLVYGALDLGLQRLVLLAIN